MDELNLYEEKQNQPNKIAKNVLVGVMLVFVGGVILGERIGIIPWWIYDIIISWQMLLVGIGMISIVHKKQLIPGVIFIIVGGVFITPKIFDLAFEIRHVGLPAILITVRLIFIFNNRKTCKHKKWEKGFKNRVDISDEYVNESYVFGGGNLVVNSDNFKGGKISAIFGGGKLDLSNSILSFEGVNILEVEFIFGGMEIIVPSDWNVVIETNSIFGGFSQKKNGITNYNVDYTKELRIKGTAIFGGGEIKRV